MRLRNIPGARETMEESTWVYTEDILQKGRWVKDIFKNNYPLHIEIGTGKGRFISELASKNQDINYLGLEKYSSVLLKALKKQENAGLKNLRLVRMDATEITDAFDEGEVSRIYLNFSDPWPKDRHAKRRLTSDRFLKRYEKILKKDGVLEFKTDNRELFEFSLEQIKNAGWEIKNFTYDLYSNEELLRDNIATEYENRFTQEGKKINKLIAVFI